MARSRQVVHNVGNIELSAIIGKCLLHMSAISKYRQLSVNFCYTCRHVEISAISEQTRDIDVDVDMLCVK